MIFKEDLKSLENGTYRYAQWSGNPNGNKMNRAMCAEEVWEDRWIPHQCLRKRGYGYKGLFCKQHAKKYARFEKQEVNNAQS